MLGALATAKSVENAKLRREPAPSTTLAECLGQKVTGFNTGSEVPIDALKSCMGQVAKRGIEDEEPDNDVTSWIIDGGHPNVIIE